MELTTHKLEPFYSPLLKRTVKGILSDRDKTNIVGALTVEDAWILFAEPIKSLKTLKELITQ